MARPSKLSPDQWLEIARRHAEGEGASALAREFEVSPASISVRVTKNSKVILETAHKLVDAQSAMSALPVAQQYAAMNLADKLRSIGQSVAAAAELGAKTGHRLHALANSEVNKVDDANPLSAESIETLKGVSALTRTANDAMMPAKWMMDSSRVLGKKEDEDPTQPVTELSDHALLQLATGGK